MTNQVRKKRSKTRFNELIEKREGRRIGISPAKYKEPAFPLSAAQREIYNQLIKDGVLQNE